MQVARACQRCAGSKRKCSGTFPCDRCVRLNFVDSCIEVQLKRVVGARGSGGGSTRQGGTGFDEDREEDDDGGGDGGGWLAAPRAAPGGGAAGKRRPPRQVPRQRRHGSENDSDPSFTETAGAVDLALADGHASSGSGGAPDAYGQTQAKQHGSKMRRVVGPAGSDALGGPGEEDEDPLAGADLLLRLSGETHNVVVPHAAALRAAAASKRPPVMQQRDVVLVRAPPIAQVTPDCDPESLDPYPAWRITFGDAPIGSNGGGLDGGGRRWSTSLGSMGKPAAPGAPEHLLANNAGANQFNVALEDLPALSVPGRSLPWLHPDEITARAVQAARVRAAGGSYYEWPGRYVRTHRSLPTTPGGPPLRWFEVFTAIERIFVSYYPSGCVRNVLSVFTSVVETRQRLEEADMDALLASAAAADNGDAESEMNAMSIDRDGGGLSIDDSGGRAGYLSRALELDSEAAGHFPSRRDSRGDLLVPRAVPALRLHEGNGGGEARGSTAGVAATDAAAAVAASALQRRSFVEAYYGAPAPVPPPIAGGSAFRLAGRSASDIDSRLSAASPLPMTATAPAAVQPYSREMLMHAQAHGIGSHTHPMAMAVGDATTALGTPLMRLDRMEVSDARRSFSDMFSGGTEWDTTTGSRGGVGVGAVNSTLSPSGLSAVGHTRASVGTRGSSVGEESVTSVGGMPSAWTSTLASTAMAASTGMPILDGGGSPSVDMWMPQTRVGAARAGVSSLGGGRSSSRDGHAEFRMSVGSFSEIPGATAIGDVNAHLAQLRLAAAGASSGGNMRHV